MTGKDHKLPDQGVPASASAPPIGHPQPQPVPAVRAAGAPISALPASQLMSIMTNPALAAATANGTLPFPAEVLAQHPAALMTMPGMMAPAQNPSATTAVPNGVLVPRLAPVAMGNQAMTNGFNGSQPQQILVPNNAQIQPGQMGMISSGQYQPVSNGFDPNTMAVRAPAAPTTSLGGIPIPPLPPHSSTAMQVQVAAAAAAAAAAPLKSGAKGGKKEDVKAARNRKSELTPEERAKQNRDRNREHARSTRLRKKAYVQKLKELVEGLHAERTEEVRKRRVAIQHLAEVQGVRRAVVRSFLKFHSNYENDPRKWMTILEDDFWFKQPVTPYRSFRRAEIERDCRMSRGIDAMVMDAASLSVMVEGIGSRSTRWMQIKCEQVISRGDLRSGTSQLPHSIVGRSNPMNHAVSSLSSSSGSSNGSAGEEDQRRKRNLSAISNTGPQQRSDSAGNNGAKKVSSSSASSSETRQNQVAASNDFHDYHAPALPDPKLGDSEESGPQSDGGNSLNGGSGNMSGSKVSTDSSSGEEDKQSDRAVKFSKRRKLQNENSEGGVEGVDRLSNAGSSASNVSGNSAGEAAARAIHQSRLPTNIAKKGGISHNIRPVASTPSIANRNARLSVAPAITLPPFMGIGKSKAVPLPQNTVVGAPVAQVPAVGNVSVGPASTAAQSSTGPAAISVSKFSKKSSLKQALVSGGPTVIAPDADTASSNSLLPVSAIRAYYHVNEDDMLLTEDVLMCPFVFRSQDAVLCGALAECVMPGMLRAHFSTRNKLMSLEMVYDAMGFMQQLERASGSEGTAQIVPGSLEMALSPNTNEARVITLAKPPFLIVSVNEAWTRLTKFTQMDVEGKDLSILNGEHTKPDASTRKGKPIHKFEEVAEGKSACSTNVHYDKNRREFVDFICSYPLTNANDRVTHILHVCKKLPTPTASLHRFQESSSNGSSSPVLNR